MQKIQCYESGDSKDHGAGLSFVHDFKLEIHGPTSGLILPRAIASTEGPHTVFLATHLLDSS